jgi:hypothetical protein
MFEVNFVAAPPAARLNKPANHDIEIGAMTG